MSGYLSLSLLLAIRLRSRFEYIIRLSVEQALSASLVMVIHDGTFHSFLLLEAEGWACELEGFAKPSSACSQATERKNAIQQAYARSRPRYA